MSGDDDDPVRLHFEAIVIYWRGPAPFFFVPVPLQDAETLRQAARSVSYGWGMIPVEAAIGGVAFRTSLFPRDGTYYLPLKDSVRRRIDVTEGDPVTVALDVRGKGGPRDSGFD